MFSVQLNAQPSPSFSTPKIATDTPVDPNFPPLPSLPSQLNLVSNINSGEVVSLDAFIEKKRLFLGKVDSARYLQVRQRLKGSPCYEEFMREPIMQSTDFEFETSYGEIVDAVATKYRSVSNLNGIFLRGGFLRYLLFPWFRKCYYLLHPDDQMTRQSCKFPPDLDVFFDASDLTLDQMHEIDMEIFHFLAKVLASKKPHLQEAYFIFCSICCYTKRSTLFAGGVYTLTTLACKDSPDLEILIASSLKRSHLCSLDSLRLRFYERTLECADGDSSEEAIWKIAIDNIDYRLTIHNPDAVDGLGFARIISHTVRGGLIQGETTFHHLYFENKNRATELENTSLCKKMQKCCENHLKGDPTALAAMFWNLFQFTDVELYRQRACEGEEKLGFQRFRQRKELEEWVLREIENPYSSIDFDWVEQSGKFWWRIHERIAYWFLPPFAIEDSTLVRLIATSWKRIPKKFLAVAIPGLKSSGPQLPVALLRLDNPRWYRHAVVLIDEIPTIEKKAAVVRSVIQVCLDKALDTALKIYKRLPPDSSLFFPLVARFRAAASMNVSLQANELGELSLLLPPSGKRNPTYAASASWLIEHTRGNPYLIYRVLSDSGYIQEVPESLFRRYNFNTMPFAEIMDSEVFALLPYAAQLPHFRRTLKQESVQFLDHSFYLAFKKDRLRTTDARALFVELAPRFSLIVIDWIFELYPKVPFEVFRTLNFPAAKVVSFRMEITHDYLVSLIDRFRGKPIELHEILFFHLELVKENRECGVNFVKLAQDLLTVGRYDEAVVWIGLLLTWNTPIPENLRKPFFQCCLSSWAHTEAADLALTLKDVSPAAVRQLLKDKNLSVGRKFALAEEFEIDGVDHWRWMQLAVPPSRQVALVIDEAEKSGLTPKEVELLIVDELFMLLSESSHSHIEICVTLMITYHHRVTKNHKLRLLSQISAYLEKAPVINTLIINSCFVIFYSSPDLTFGFLEILLAAKMRPLLHGLALAYITNNSFHKKFKMQTLGTLTQAGSWKDLSDHEKGLIEVMTGLVEEGVAAEDLLKMLDLFLGIPLHSIQRICGTILTSAIPQDKANHKAWYETYYRWVDIQFDPVNHEKGTVEHLGTVLTILKNGQEHLREDQSMPIKVGTGLIRLLMMRIRWVGTRPNDLYTKYVMCGLGSFLVQFAQNVQAEEALYSEFAANTCEVAEFLLNHKLTEEEYASFSELFAQFWIFLSERYVKLASSDLPQKQVFAKAKAEKLKNPKKEAVDVRKKVALLNSCIKGLSNQEECKIFLMIKTYLQELLNFFPEHIALILPCVHKLVFSSHSPSAPALEHLRRKLLAKFYSDLISKHKIGVCPELAVEMTFYCTRSFQNFMPRHEEIRIVKAMLLRMVASGHPMWVCDGILFIDTLKPLIPKRDYYLFMYRMFTAAANNISVVTEPCIGENVMLLSIVLINFTESGAVVPPEDLENGVSMRDEVVQLLFSGGLKHVNRFAKVPHYSNLFELLIQFTCILRPHIANTVQFDFLNRLIVQARECPLEQEVKTKLLMSVTAVADVVDRVNLSKKCMPMLTAQDMKNPKFQLIIKHAG